MLPAHRKYVRRFNSVKNPVRKTEKYCAAKENKRMFRELHLIYENIFLLHAAVGTCVCGIFLFIPKICSAPYYDNTISYTRY